MHKGRPADDGDERFAELVPFPAAPPPAGLEPEDDVTDAELVPVGDQDLDDEDLDPASARYQGGALVASGELPEELPVLEGELIEDGALDGRFEPRPILPAWMLDRTQRRMVVRWLARHAGHTAAFHAVRLPRYVARAVAYSPRGLARAVASAWRWVLDLEARPISRSAIERGDVGGYLALSRQSAVRLRARLWAIGIGLGAATAAVVAGRYVWRPLPAVVLGAALGLLGWAGRRKDRPFVEASVTIKPGARKLTPDLLVQAFVAARLCTEANPITFARPIVPDGEGYLAVVDLPYGAKASTAVARREDIAAGLDIDEVQVFVSRIRGSAGSARRVTIWVANADPYAQKPPTTPLASIESVDFWKPWPFGIDARMRLVELCLVWSSALIGAIPRMGKTYAARLPAAAAALDPFVQLYVFDGKGGKDWQPFEAVAHRYGSGVRGAVVEHLAQCLTELVDEMNRRYEKLRELPNDVCPEGKLTPAIARNRSLNMPLVLVCIDEVQRYLEHPELGPLITELLIELAKVGPAVGIMFVLATQRPDAKTLPEGLRGQIGTRFALKVMNWQSSETILGAGTKAEGLDASKLLRAHKGVGILLGADDGALAEAGGQIVRTHLMDLPTLQTIVERGRELRIKAGTLTGVAAGEEPISETPAPRLLDQVLDVFGAGEARLWSETIVARLADKDPDRFDGWSSTDLANALRPYGVETAQVWGQTPGGEGANRRGVAREAVAEALGRSIDTRSRRDPEAPRGR